MQQIKWPLNAFDLSQSIELIFSSVTAGFRRKTPRVIKFERDKKIALRKKRKTIDRKPEETDIVFLTKQQVRYLREAPLAELALKAEVARCNAAFQSYDKVIDEAWNLLEEHRQK
jgi:hypothetical protein